MNPCVEIYTLFKPFPYNKEQSVQYFLFYSLRLYCSTLHWVDVALVQSGRVAADKVVTVADSAVCRSVMLLQYSNNIKS